MSEVEVTLRTSLPRTRQSLVCDLLNTSLTPGMTVLIHSSLSSLGWVCGGSVAVVQALMDVITPAGTLVIPTFTGDYSDPSMWQAPPVPVEWWSIILDTPRSKETGKLLRVSAKSLKYPTVKQLTFLLVISKAWNKRLNP